MDGKKIEAIIDACRDKLPADLEIRSCEGSGEDGSVFSTPNPDVVIKFVGESEARVTQFIFNRDELKTSPHFPKIYKIVDITDICEAPETLFAIKREDINQSINQSAYSHLSQPAQIICTKVDPQEIDHLAIETLLADYEADRDQLKSFADAVIAYAGHGLYLEDIGGDNLGIRNGTIVIRDFGKGTIEPPKTNPYFDYDYCEYCGYEIEWCECSPFRHNPDVLLQMAKRAWESELSLENAQRYINLLRRSGVPFGEALPMSELRRTKDSRFLKRYILKELNRQFYPEGSPLETVEFIRRFRRGSVKADIAMIYYNYEHHGELELSAVIAMADLVNRIIGGEISLVYFQIMGEDSIRIDIEIVQGE